jgi:Tn3 transposase DDE domain
MFHGRKGELRHGYREGMEDQLGALGLILNTITLWNTVYLDHALEQLRATGYPVLDADVARLSPYMRRHINFHGPLLLRAHRPRRRTASAARPRRPRRRLTGLDQSAAPQETAHSLRSRDESGTLLCAVVVHDAGPRAA